MSKNNALSISPEQLAELKAADPSAFDLDNENETEVTTEVADPIEEGVKDAMAEIDAGEGRTDDEAGKKPILIPKARFDEAIEKERQRNDALAARLEALESKTTAQATTFTAPAAPMDFEAEQARLQTKYDNGEIDYAEHMAESHKISVAQAKYEIKVEMASEQQAAAEANVKTDWDAKINEFMTTNEDFLADPINREDFERYLDAYQKTDPNISNDELIAKASEAAMRRANWAPGAATKAPDPHAARNASDARATAAAGRQPGPFTGGSGSRSDTAIDINTLRPGEFGKLSKADQEKLLGAGAV